MVLDVQINICYEKCTKLYYTIYKKDESAINVYNLNLTLNVNYYTMYKKYESGINVYNLNLTLNVY